MMPAHRRHRDAAGKRANRGGLGIEHHLRRQAVDEKGERDDESLVTVHAVFARGDGIEYPR
jgi:hypothetical protein